MSHWGVDSTNPINRRVEVGRWSSGGGRPRGANRQVGDSGRSLYDFVVDHYGRAPAFWGRYINRHEDSRSRIQPGEIDDLRWKLRETGQACRIVPIYNAIDRERGRPGQSFVPSRHADPGNAFDAGIRAGEEAQHLAFINHILAGVHIYADLESWQVHPAWIQGWVQAFTRTRWYAEGGGFCGKVLAPESTMTVRVATDTGAETSRAPCGTPQTTRRGTGLSFGRPGRAPGRKLGPPSRATALPTCKASSGSTQGLSGTGGPIGVGESTTPICST